MSIKIETTCTTGNTNIKGLAGHQGDGVYIMRNQSEIPVNATEKILFEFAESCMLLYTVLF
jgi:hypothetical protein